VDLTSITAMDLGAQLAQKKLCPVDLVEHVLQQAEASKSVFISLTPDRARAEAVAAKERIRLGLNRSPLEGVPLAWKDLFDMAGSVTTAGSLVLSAETPARRDAHAIYNAAAAGMVNIGKTNLSELAYSGLGLNPHYGTPEGITSKGAARAPGGSSSGSALAVAKGVVTAAIGTDTAGSLRVPAAFNGLISYRPSQQRHCRKGVTPLARSLDTIGVIARSLADCIAIDDIMRCGHIQQRAPARTASCSFVLDTSLADDSAIQPAVWENLKRTADRLQQAGYLIEERPIRAVQETLELIATTGWLGAIEAYTEYRALLENTRADAWDARVRKRLLDAKDISADRALRLYSERTRLIDLFTQELQGALLITPTVAQCAPLLTPLEEDPDLFAKINLQTLRLPMVGSFLDTPAVVYPNGVDADGQFTSVQFSGGRGSDERLLSVAMGMDSALSIGQV